MAKTGLEALEARLLAKLEEETKQAQQAMRAAAVRAVNDEARNFFVWLSLNMINRDQSADLAKIAGTWQPLDPAYLRRRAKRHPTSKGFFQASSKLRFDMIGLGDATKVFGGAEVGAPKAGKLTDGDYDRVIYARPFKNIHSALKYGEWDHIDRVLALDQPSALPKLFNRGQGTRYYRPLVGPAIMLFIKAKLPQAIKDRLTRLGYKVK